MAQKPTVKFLIVITNTEGARMGYGSDAPFVTIETRALYENGSIYGVENIKSFFSDQEFIRFVQMVIGTEQGTHKTFSWVRQ